MNNLRFKSNPKSHHFLKTVTIIHVLFSEKISLTLIRENEDLNTTTLHVIVTIF